MIFESETIYCGSVEKLSFFFHQTNVTEVFFSNFSKQNDYTLYVQFITRKPLKEICYQNLITPQTSILLQIFR